MEALPRGFQAALVSAFPRFQGLPLGLPLHCPPAWLRSTPSPAPLAGCHFRSSWTQQEPQGAWLIPTWGQSPRPPTCSWFMWGSVTSCHCGVTGPGPVASDTAWCQLTQPGQRWWLLPVLSCYPSEGGVLEAGLSGAAPPPQGSGTGVTAQ